MGTKIVRKLMKQFGESAASTEFDQFGSLAAGSLVTSKDPDVIQALSEYLNGWMAAVMGNNSPVLEDMNAICYLFAYMLCYNQEMGVPEWLGTTEYFIGSVANSAGVLYISLTDNNLGNAVTDTANWKTLVSKPLNPQVTPTLANRAVGTWTNQNQVDDFRYLSTVWSPELALLVTVGDGAATSSDGITWAHGTTPFFLNSVAWSPELKLFAATSESGVGVATSPDGVVWTSRTITANSWEGITWAPELGLFVAVAASGASRVATSPDGITWTTHAAAEANSWTSVVWSSELLLAVAVSTDGTHRVMTSPDGITWTARTAAAANQWFRVTWSPDLGLYAAVAFNNSGANQAMTSRDGITWAAHSLGSGNDWRDVLWAPEVGLFLAIAVTGKYAYSHDGLTWTTAVSGFVGFPESIGWSPVLGLATITGLNTGAAGKALHSKYVKKFIAA